MQLIGGEEIYKSFRDTFFHILSDSKRMYLSAHLHYGGVFINFVLILPHEQFCGAKFFKSLLSILEKSYVNQSCSYNFVDQKPK